MSISTTILLCQTAKSKPIVFEKLFSRIDDATKSALSTVTLARAEFLEALSNSSTYTITAAEKYLPYLYGLIAKLPDKDAPIPSISCSWTSAIGKAYTTSFFTSNQWHFEAVNVLMCYALAHRERASELLHVALDDAMFSERKSEITRLLCTAAGIFDYIKEVELHRWGQKPTQVIVEKLVEPYAFLSSVCLAEAQALAIKFAVIKQMDVGLIASLCVDVRDKYLYCENLLKQIGSLHDRFSDYCLMNVAIFDLQAHRYAAAELLATKQYGRSVSMLRKGLDGAATVSTPWNNAGGVNILKDNFKEVKDVVQRSYDSEFRSNTTLYYQEMPPPCHMQLPLARGLAKPVPFSAPEPYNIQIAFQEGWGCSVM